MHLRITKQRQLNEYIPPRPLHQHLLYDESIMPPMVEEIHTPSLAPGLEETSCEGECGHVTVVSILSCGWLPDHQL